MQRIEGTKMLNWDTDDGFAEVFDSEEQRRYRQRVGNLAWMDFMDARCCIGRVAQSFGKARAVDIGNVLGTFCFERFVRELQCLIQLVNLTLCVRMHLIVACPRV